MSLVNKVIQCLENGDTPKATKLLKQKTAATKGEKLYAEGLIALAQNNHTEAKSLFKKALRSGHQDPDLLVNYSYLLNESGEYRESVSILRAGRISFPLDAGIEKNLLQALLLSGLHQEAIHLLEELLARGEDTPLILLKYAEVLNLTGKNQACLDALKKLNPSQNISVAHVALLKSNAYMALKQHELACSTLESALTVVQQTSREFAKLFNIYVQRTIETSRFLDIEILEKGKENPFPDAHHGLALWEDHRGEQQSADKSFRSALRLAPLDQFITIDYGKFLARSDRIEEAESILITHQPTPPISAEFYYALGTFFNEIKKELKKANQNFRLAIGVDQENPNVLSDLLLTTLRLADWKALRNQLEILYLPDKVTPKAISPFVFSLLVDNPNTRLENAKAFCDRMFSHHAFRLNKKRANRPKIAYISSDLRTHAVGYLVKEYLAHHNRKKFDLSLVYTGPRTQDPLHLHFRCDVNFIDLTGIPKSDWLSRLKDEMFDLVVDLNGHTAHNVYGCLSHRVAPVQATFLGFPGSSGLANMDFIIADKYLIPEGSEKYYSEEVYKLPFCYQPSDSSREVSQNIFRKSDFGIRNEEFVFCCFNNSPKLSEFICSAWVKILKHCPHSVLILLDDNRWSTENLTNFFTQAGIKERRIVFLPRTEIDRHLARHQVVDLFLDTFPYGAHTTANDAIFCGVPVLTLVGEGFASRVAYSLNMHIDMAELCTFDIDQYVETACRIYSDRVFHLQVKEKLAENMRRYEFGNSERFAREMEFFWEYALSRP